MNSEVQEVLSKLNYEQQKFQAIPVLKENLETKHGRIAQRVEAIKQKLGQISIAREFYQKAIDRMYEQAKGEMEQAITMALQYVFYDKKFECEIDLGDKRGKSMDFIIRDVSNPRRIFQVDMKDGTGQGIRSVVSFVSQVYFVLSKGFPFLFIDEGYTGLNEKYVDRFFTFVRSFCDQKELIFVLITQDPRFVDYGDVVYTVMDGVIERDTNVRDNG